MNINLHQKKHWIIGGVIMGVTGTLVLLLIYILARNHRILDDDKKHMVKEIELDLPGKHINKQDIWMHKIESESKMRDKKIELLGDATKKQVGREDDTNNTDLRSLKKDIEDIKQFVAQLSQAQHTEVHGKQDNAKPRSRGIKQYSFQLTDRAGTVRDTIPAGGFAKAVLLNGVDISVSVTGDPQHVTLRVLDDGQLPNNFRSHIKCCILIGSARGDLSSERVYIRLEKLSYIDPDGKVIEINVSGYVSGEDGKAGLKGTMVDRAEAMARGAALSEFFGGMSRFLLSTDLLKLGKAQGISSGFDKLAAYHIKLEEQLQPVIQIASGRRVDIVFTKSVKFGYKERKEEVND